VSDDKEQPIIIKRIRKGHGGHHGGAWKVAFADFMTAMMAFFLVMWLVGQSPQIRESVAGHFRDPGKFQKQGGAGLLKGGTAPVKLEDRSKGVQKDASSGGGKGPTEKEKDAMGQAAQLILEQLEKQREFDRLKKNIKIQLTSEGLRIILNESEDSPAFFEPGSAKLLQKSAVILITIARELGNLKNRIVVEGHTDASYGGSKDYSNWELSADRANSARQLMEVSGLYDGQIREVRGFADKFPMIADNPGDHRNRRVSLVVLYKSREAQFDQIEVGEDLLAQSGK